MRVEVALEVEKEFSRLMFTKGKFEKVKAEKFLIVFHQSFLKSSSLNILFKNKENFNIFVHCLQNRENLKFTSVINPLL